MSYQIVLSTCSGVKEAEHIAQTLVESGLAACVNIVPAVASVYRWQGKLERAQEALMIVKALAQNYYAIERHIKEQHSYDMPEIIALPITQGSRRYLDWIGSPQDMEGA